jgi:hypothetical protein
MNANGNSAQSDSLIEESGATPGALWKPPIFQRTDWLSAGATTLLALLVYLLTLGPSVGLDNSGVWTTAAAYGGVASPPGYSPWILWAWAFTKLLPFSNIAWRAAVSSAAAGALACGLIALMVSRVGTAILEKASDQHRLKPGEEKWLRGVCGYAAGMVFGLNGAFWPQAVMIEVWPLSILLLCLVLCLLLGWIFQPERRRYLYAAALVYGLLLTNSQIELVFAPAIPFLVMTGNQKVGRDFFLAAGTIFLVEYWGYWPGYLELFDYYHAGEFPIFVLSGTIMSLMAIGLVIRTRRAFTEWKAILICGGSLLLGLAFYFYLPVASMTNPPVNWGYPRTVEGFFHVVTRGQYEKAVPAALDWQFLKAAASCFLIAGREFGWLYLPLCLVPFCFLHRMAAPARYWTLGLLPVYGCLAFFMLAVLNPGVERQSQELNKVYFTASYVVLAFWMGCGLIILGNWMARPGKRPETAHFPI